MSHNQTHSNSSYNIDLSPKLGLITAISIIILCDLSLVPRPSSLSQNCFLEIKKMCVLLFFFFLVGGGREGLGGLGR